LQFIDALRFANRRKLGDWRRSCASAQQAEQQGQQTDGNKRVNIEDHECKFSRTVKVS
jgi:hypothetical protein